MVGFDLGLLINAQRLWFRIAMTQVKVDLTTILIIGYKITR